MKTSSLLIYPDTHAPFHDKKALALVNQVCAELHPDRKAFLGDFIDCFTVSDHDKDTTRLSQLEDELDTTNGLLDEIDAMPSRLPTVFCMGNHEDRLWRYLVRRAPALLATVSVPKLLRFKERGYQCVEYRKHVRLGKLYLTHDVGHAGVSAVRATGAAMGTNVVIGHTHRLGIQYTGSVDGKRFVSASMGWLGDADAAEYLPEAKKREWQLGFGLARFEPNGNVHLQAIPIVDYRCLVDGKCFELKRRVYG